MSANYLFMGPELGEKNDAINAIRQKIKKEYGEAEESSFYAGEAAFPDILAALLNGSLFAAARLFFIKNAELITKKNEIEGLASYIKHPQDNTTLILISDSTKIDAGVEKLFGAGGKNDTGGGYKKIFYEMFEENKERWLVSFFRKEGINLEGAAADAILDMVENNTQALRGECSRLALYLKKEGKNKLSEELVFELLSQSKQLSVFSLFSSLAKAEVKSFDIMHGIIAAGEAPQMIFAALASSFRKYRDYCLLLRTMSSPSDFDLKKIGVNFFNKKDFSQAHRVYGDIADRCLSLVAEYDILTRSNFALSGILLDIFVYKIISLRR
jgi:DNA polymerase-3 subunit delta